MKQSPSLQTPHGFFGERLDNIACFDCALDGLLDTPAVLQNRQQALERAGLQGRQLVLLNQVHGADVLQINAPPREPLHGDALWTANPNLALGILTADCVSVLLYAPAARMVGAIHAGWPGALAGIVGRCVTALHNASYHSPLQAVIGACIRAASYEVGLDLYERYKAAWPKAQHFFNPQPNGKFLFDLPGFVSWQLTQAGVTSIHDLQLDTRPADSGFFSHRRAVAQGLPKTGRNLTLIGLPCPT